MIQIWTDGSGVWDDKQQMPIGYAAVIRAFDYVIELAGWSPVGTNNRAELLAAIIGLRALNIEPACKEGVLVHCDSQYVIGQASKMQRTNVNHDLVKELQLLSDERMAKWKHVRGHSGDWGNERCDVLAGWARKLPIDKDKQQVPFIVHFSLYHQDFPQEDLLMKGVKEMCQVNTGQECLRLKLLL